MSTYTSITTYVLDDEPGILVGIQTAFEAANIPDCSYYQFPKEMLDVLSPAVDIAIIDFGLSGAVDGLYVMREVYKHNPAAFCIAMSATQNADVVIDFLNAGVSRFVRKKNDPNEWIPELVKMVRDGHGYVLDMRAHHDQQLAKLKLLDEQGEDLEELKRIVTKQG